MKPFTSKHCTQYLTKESPFHQEEELAEKKMSRKKYDRKMARATKLDEKADDLDKNTEKKFTAGARLRRQAGKIRRKLPKYDSRGNELVIKNK